MENTLEIPLTVQDGKIVAAPGHGRQESESSNDSSAEEVLSRYEELREKFLQDQGQLKQGQGGLLSGVADIEIMGVNVGEGLIGGAVAIFGAELLDGFFNQQGTQNTRAMLKLAAAWGLLNVDFITDNIGRKPAEFGAAFLAFSAARDVLPIDDWITRALRSVRGIAGMSQGQPRGGGSLNHGRNRGGAGAGAPISHAQGTVQDRLTTTNV
ncbi:MAG: hypothetical protein GWN58_28540 [Anaerolineae bacterium]|nr:hypothetical protein [Anaerolineae bacterium]